MPVRGLRQAQPERKIKTESENPFALSLSKGARATPKPLQALCATLSGRSLANTRW
jgi:hypothetical protein